MDHRSKSASRKRARGSNIKVGRVIDESTTITSNRITTGVGVFNQGKISQVAERRQNTSPETVARNAADLQSILTIADYKKALNPTVKPMVIKSNVRRHSTPLPIPIPSPILETDVEEDKVVPLIKVPKEIKIHGFDIISEVCMAHLNDLGFNPDKSDPVFKDVKISFIKNKAEVLAACYGDPEDPIETPENEMICIADQLVDDTFALDLCCEMKGGHNEDLPFYRMEMPDSFLFPKLSPSQVFVEREYQMHFDEMIENSDKKKWDYSCFHRFLPEKDDRRFIARRIF